MPHRKIGHRACDQQPRALFREQDGECQERKPRSRLAGRSCQDEGFSMLKPVQRFDREQLGPGAHQLRQGGEEADLERACVEQQCEGRQVVLAPALHDGLKGALADSVAPASFAGLVLFSRRVVHPSRCEPHDWMFRRVSGPIARESRS